MVSEIPAEDIEFYDEEVVKWHTVKRGETLSKIARKYGVTVAEIRKYNRVGKSVKAGKKLKIVSTRRVYRPKVEEKPVTDADTMALTPVVPADTTLVATPDTTTVAGSVEAAFSETKVAPKVEEEPKAKPKATKKKEAPKPRTHTVRRGENLSKIATRYGTTVAKIKKANNLKNNNIQAGQRLSIP